MDKEALERRLREEKTERDILLHRLVEAVNKVDHCKEILENLEDIDHEHHS